MVQDVKPFKIIEEQIAILEDRGVIVEDEEYVRKSLSICSKRLRTQVD